ncbi:MAG: hypothetical protein HDR88_04875 [Bacteroides sp.]|nr:hypothetical protein [Bacteroides sp.]
MRLLKYMLPLLALLVWSATVLADYDPASPPEPGVNFTLTTRCIPAGGAGSMTGTATHAFGSSVRMEAYPASGFSFVQWEDEEGNIISEEQNFLYSMPSHDVTLIARFEYNPDSPTEPGTPEFKQYSKVFFTQIPLDAGSLECYNQSSYQSSGASIEVGTSVRLRADAHSDFRFINWTLEDEVVSETSEFSYTVGEEDLHFVAHFEYTPENPAEPGEQHFSRTLSLRSNPEGGGSLSGAGTMLDGTSQRVYTNPNPYYTFLNWTDDNGEVVSEEREFYYTMPNRDVTLTANFSYDYNPGNPEEPGIPEPPSSVAENMVNYPRFGMYDDTHVIILCETEGSTIHYTLDGSDPTEESPVYTEPVFVPSNLLVKAIAYKEGMEHSPIRSYQVMTYRAIAPIFYLENKQIVIASETPDAIIRFTTDFSEPNEESEVFTTPFVPEENCRIKAYASKEGLTDSRVSIFVYRRADYTIAAPTFELDDDGKLVITAPVEGAVTRYTTDGSDPDEESTVYTEPLTLDGNGVIKAYATHINYYDSPISEYTVDGFFVEPPVADFLNPVLKFTTPTTGAQIRYTLDGSIPTEESDLFPDEMRLTEDTYVIARGFKDRYVPSETTSFSYVYNDYLLPTPTASFANRVLTLTCADPEAQIHYTTDDSEPTVSSTLYEGPISLTEDCTVKFIATRDNFNDSPVGSFVFVLVTYRVETPAFNYDAVNKTMTMTCATEDAIIRYTIDGTVPEENTGLLYEGPVEVPGNLTFTARGFRNDLFPSTPAVLSINDQSVPIPSASFANLRLTITCEDNEASIYYTTDGSTPNEQSTLYTEPVALTEDCTVRFIGVHENFNNSPVGSYDFVRSYFAVATPIFTYKPESHMVSIATATEEAEIRYTTDGSDPTQNTGTVFSSPIEIVGNQTFTARAFKENFFESEAATLIIDDQKVPSPVASFANRVLTITCPDAQATIYYTTDGTEPSAASMLYEIPVSLTSDCTVRAIAIRENFIDSDIVTVFNFVYNNYRVAQPSLNYNAADKTVAMGCATDNAEIRYTTDGTVPTATTGTVYSDPVAVVGNQTFTVRGFRNDLFDSESAVLEITDQTVPIPTASFSDLRLTLTCEDSAAAIYYNTDGSTPTEQSNLYTAPLAITQDCVVTFIAVRENFNNSPVGTYDFVRANFAVATPVLTYNQEEKIMTITSETEEAQIRYTTDGSEPTENNGTTYEGPFTVVGNHSFIARAFKENFFESELGRCDVTDQMVPTPTASFSDLRLTIVCADPDATIYYRTDGSDATAESTLYTGPVELTENCTVTFIAVRENFNDSHVGSYDFVRADFAVATPMFSYDPDTKTLTISTETDGAVIRYTTDGTDPTENNGTAYENPIEVIGNQTFKARAFKENMFESEIATLPIDDQKVPTPVASFANRVLTITCPDASAQIHYTIGEEDPTEESPVYTEPLALTEDCIVSFIAIRDNFNNSDVDSFDFVYDDYRVATPTLNYDSASRTMTMGCSTDGAEIRYTTDGTVPTATTGTVYTAPFIVVGNQTFTAVAFRNDLFDSEVETKTVDDQAVKKPQAEFTDLHLTLTCEDEGAQIHYNIGNSAPTEDSPLYEEPLALTEDCIVSFIAIRDNFNNSEVGTFDFVYDDYRVATPTLNYDSASRILTMGCSTEGAEIRYTTDGTVPTVSTGTVYSEPIVVVGNQTFTAVAFRDDLFDSEPATLPIIDHYVPNPTASFANKVLTLSCSDPLAKIHYSIGNSEPTEESTLYEEPIALTEDCTVRFIATRDRFNNSEVEDFEFVYERYRVARPTLNYDSGSRTMTMGCSTEGAEIRYTTDGTIPTATTGTVYTAPFTVVGNQTFTAVAFRNDLFDSEVETKTVDDQAVRTPQAEFTDLHLTLTCEDEGARIYYTFGDSTPTEQSTLYEGPVALTADCIVNFIGVLESFNNSPVGTFTFVRSNYAVATPTLTFDRENLTVYIETETEGASIRYTTDGSVPEANTGMAYEGPIPVVGNHVFTARAFKENLFDSEPRPLPITDQTVPTPVASFGNRVLTITCPDTLAQIHYTTDGTEPSEESTVYKNPLSLVENCTVRFMATRENFNNSAMDTIIFVYDQYRVKAPDLNYNSTTKLMEMKCATDNAVIRYTTDDSLPTDSTGTVYSEPITVIGNLPFKAVAFRSDLFDSAPTEVKVTDQGVSVPTARYNSHTVILECEDTEAEIRYIINGEEMPSEPYTTPIPVENDCTIRFMAVRDNFNNSPIDSYDFVLADHREKTPDFNPDYRNRKVTVTQKDNLDVRVTIGGNTATYNTPAVFNVTPGTGTISAVAIARNQDTYDSETNSNNLVFHLAPKIDYNGHKLSVTARDNKPLADSAKFNVIFNDQPLPNSMEIEDFGTVIAIVESDSAFRSEPETMDIDFFNTGYKAGAQNGHSLSEGFGTWDDVQENYTELEVVGELTKDDLAFLAKLPNLTTLTLDPVEMVTEPCDSIFAGTRIETITLPDVPEGILKGMPRLTTVVWESDEVFPEETVTDAANPNLLLWVKNKDLAPANAINVVADGEADTIRLQAGFPFNAHKPFEAGYIELTKVFAQETTPEICRGWETIAIPFQPTTIKHESKGEIIPFSAWKEGSDDSLKPFWLYRATSSGWEAADIIEAGEPYIISMPNYYKYIEAYQLNGKIIFAADNVELGSDESTLRQVDWIDGRKFEATYMPVDDETVLSLNVPMPDIPAHNEDLPGSMFVPNGKTLPMGAYLTAAGNPQKVPVFGGFNGITLPTVTDSGIIVEVIGTGTLRISSTRNCTVAVYTPTGVMMRRVDINAGESVIVDDLAKGIYIVAGCKVMVN